MASASSIEHPNPSLTALQRRITACRLCPRLVSHREEIARTKRRAYMEWEYWGRPVPSFGDPKARLLVLGLAPGAHGANRTGRMFTGDRSGDFLYRALFEAGFANQPTSVSADDGLVLQDAYITAPAHCVPPGNKPLPEELAKCRPYLVEELSLLPQVKVVVVLGRIAFDTYLSILKQAGKIAARSGFAFSHGAEWTTHANGPVLLASYHPSQQNTSTGKLTAAMLRDIFLRAKELVSEIRVKPEGRAADKAAGRPPGHR